MKIGPYEIHSLETGRFSLDGGAMFGVVPKAFWARTNPPDDQNRIEMAARALLVLFEDRKILVDVGIGHKLPSKFEQIYNLEYGRFTLAKSLAQYHLQAEQITDVVLTHCHFDHAGGATCQRGTLLVPTFPRATHYLQKSHWEWALKPSEKDRGSFLSFEENLGPIRDREMLKLLDGSDELFPGFELVVSNGHTVGLQMVRIQEGSSVLFYCSDLIPTCSHLPLPYIMSYDLFPLTTLEEKRELLNHAVEEDWIVALEHDPSCEAIRIKKGEKYFEVKERVRL